MARHGDAIADTIVSLRAHRSELLLSIDVQPPAEGASLPLWLAWAAAATGEWVCAAVGCEPPITRQALVLVGQEVTVSDAKARAELGYKGAVGKEQGLAGVRAWHQRGAGRGDGAGPRHYEL